MVKHCLDCNVELDINKIGTKATSISTIIDVKLWYCVSKNT